MFPDYSIEEQFPGRRVIGIDEVGRGPLAGPVFAGAVIVDKDQLIPGIKDSKKLTPSARNKLYEIIMSTYICSIGMATVEEIDEFNITNATKLAMNRALLPLIKDSDIVLIDGNMKFENKNYKSIINGDNKSVSIAAASIIAKVSRDSLMEQLHQEFPNYGWNQNKGYPTKNHSLSILKHGITIHHRKSFRIPSYL